MSKLGHEANHLSEAEFLAKYQVQEYPRPSVTSDLAILTIRDNILRLMLIQRGGHPFKDCWALPGGFLDVPSEGIRALADQYNLDLMTGSTADWPEAPRRLSWELEGEARGLRTTDPITWDPDIETCAHRELEEETSLPKGSCYLEQLCTVGSATRDPRTYVVTVAHYALVPSNLMSLVKPQDDAKNARWFPVETVSNMPLAFDHHVIVKTALDRVRGKIDYFAGIAAGLLPPTFTETELRMVYETIKGESFNRGKVSRKLARMIEDGHIVQAEGFRRTGGRRASVFQFS